MKFNIGKLKMFLTPIFPYYNFLINLEYIYLLLANIFANLNLNVELLILLCFL